RSARPRTCSGRCREARPRTSLEERRGRDPGFALNPVDPEEHVVDVAPAPVLARLERADDRMLGLVGVGGRVAVGGVVAAADVTAGEADAEVQPLAADAEAVLAAVHGRRQFAQPDLVEVGAELAHPTRSAVAARCSWTNWTAIDPSPTAA